MRKWILLIFLILLLPIAIVMAKQGDIETYKPNEVFDLSIHLTNSTGEISNANCSVRIQNISYDLLSEEYMNEIGNGWYNYTYNTSKIGKYFCRQNCTKNDNYIADTCDFIIEGENMSLATFFGLGIILLFYMGLVIFLRVDLFSQHGLIKAFIILGVAWFMLIPINLLILFNSDNGASANIISTLDLVYLIAIWANYIISFYIFLWLIISMLKKILKSRTRNV